MPYREPEYRRRIREKAEQDHREAKRERDKAQDRAEIRDIAASVESLRQKLESQHDENKAEQNGRRRRQYWEIGGLWAAAAVGVIAICIGSWDAHEQRSIMQQQFSEAEVGQRPWIEPHITIKGIRFDKEKNATLFFHISYQNIGKTPAQNVQVRITSAVVTNETVFDSIAEEINQCKLARKDAEVAKIPGAFLFPGEAAPEMIHGSGEGSATISNTEYSKAWPDGQKVIFKLVGCIDYMFSDTNGDTGFSYTIKRRGGDGANLPYFITPEPGDVPAEQLIFERDPFSGGYIK